MNCMKKRSLSIRRPLPNAHDSIHAISSSSTYRRAYTLMHHITSRGTMVIVFDLDDFERPRTESLAYCRPAGLTLDPY